VVVDVGHGALEDWAASICVEDRLPCARLENWTQKCLESVKITTKRN